MNLPSHFLFTSVLAATLFPFFGWASIAAILGGFFIDIDHYFWYIYRFRKFSISACYRHYGLESEKTNYHNSDGALHIFHTAEFFLLLVTASLFYMPAVPILIGYLGHALLDAVWLATVPKRVILDHSILHWLWNNKIKTVK